MLSRLLFTLPLLACGAIAHAEHEDSLTPSVSERQLARTARYLSSDELEGRGLGTPGLDWAAEYIAEQFSSIGLETAVFQGGPRQEFPVTLGASLGNENSCAIRGLANGEPTEIRLAVGEDFNPLAIGADGDFDLPLVWGGYGITAPEHEYDDYAHVDVTGKAVIVLRHEPQQANPHGAFAGNENSEHAALRRKVSNAYQHGAAAVVFCTDAHDLQTSLEQWEKRIEAAEKELAAASDDSELERLSEKLAEYRARREAQRDPVLDFQMAGDGDQSREIPVLHVRRGVVESIVAASGHDLGTIESEIDRSLQPYNVDLYGWRISGQVDIKREQVDVCNVAAVLEGVGPRAEETILIGAHFDHLGRGGEGSAEPGSREIHNGADDNASGVAALLDVAARLSARPVPLGRRVVFVAFTGEERGLLGSAAYARQPPFPLEETVAMLNFDMVGRLQNNSLIISGTGTAEEFDGLLDAVNERHGFEVSRSSGGFGPSDHSTFFAKQIPVLHFFTGSHTDYHRPSDDFEHLNIQGMRRVSEFVADLVERIADSPQRLTYVEAEQQPLGDSRPNPRPYFGSIPDFANAGGGYAISGVGPGSPADEAGLVAGDVIVQFGDYKVGNLEDFDGALRKYEAGDKVPVLVKRADEQIELHVTLDPPR